MIMLMAKIPPDPEEPNPNTEDILILRWILSILHDPKYPKPWEL